MLHYPFPIIGMNRQLHKARSLLLQFFRPVAQGGFRVGVLVAVLHEVVTAIRSRGTRLKGLTSRAGP